MLLAAIAATACSCKKIIEIPATPYAQISSANLFADSAAIIRIIMK